MFAASRTTLRTFVERTWRRFHSNSAHAHGSAPHVDAPYTFPPGTRPSKEYATGHYYAPVLTVTLVTCAITAILTGFGPAAKEKLQRERERAKAQQ